MNQRCAEDRKIVRDAMAEVDIKKVAAPDFTLSIPTRIARSRRARRAIGRCADRNRKFRYLDAVGQSAD